MDPRLKQAQVKKLSEQFDPEKAARRIERGATIAEALELPPSTLEELRNQAFELVATGHVARARATVRMIAMLGDVGPTTGMLLAACLAREGKLDESRALADKCLGAIADDQRADLSQRMAELFQAVRT